MVLCTYTVMQHCWTVMQCDGAVSVSISQSRATQPHEIFLNKRDFKQHQHLACMCLKFKLRFLTAKASFLMWSFKSSKCTNIRTPLQAGVCHNYLIKKWEDALMSDSYIRKNVTSYLRHYKRTFGNSLIGLLMPPHLLQGFCFSVKSFVVPFIKLESFFTVF